MTKFQIFEKVSKSEWIKCPICGNKTRDKIRTDTVIKSFPLFCPKCKKESLIDVENLTVKVIAKSAN